MKRIFSRLTMAFGNQMVAKWEGLNMHDVYEDWAEQMKNFSLGALKHGLDVARQKEYPPSQGEFISYCKTSQRFDKPMNDNEMLPSKATATYTKDPKEEIKKLWEAVGHGKFSNLVNGEFDV
jgi:hypothetical protein